MNINAIVAYIKFLRHQLQGVVMKNTILKLHGVAQIFQIILDTVVLLVVMVRRMDILGDLEG